MRMALAGWLGCAAGAAGRDVPIYREYSRPIAFYDETGRRTADGLAAPDRTAQRSLRDAQAQEGLMGKETLLEVTFGQGTSVFGREVPPSGKMAPVADGGEESDRRQKKGETGGNWLAQSLALPSLGQATSNAALAAMSAEESSWGWLADDLANAKDDGLANPVPDGEAGNPLAGEQDALRTGAPDPLAEPRAGKETDAMNRSKDAPGSDPGDSKPDPTKATDGAAPPRERADAAASRSAPTPFAAEMSRTRDMLAEMTASVRPDTSSFWMGTESPASRDAGMSAPPRQSLFSADAPSWGGISSAGAGPGVPSTFGVIPTEASVAGWGSWKGAWSAQGAGTDGSGAGGLSRFQNLADPTPAVQTTPTRDAFKSGASGGYTPAWY